MPVFNDAAPTNATILGQGSITPLNGKTASGTAIAYTTGGTTIIIRLQALSVTAEAGMQLVVLFNNSSTLQATLRGFTGNQNYTFTVGSGGTGVSSIFLRSVQVPSPTNDYATANIL